MTSLVRKVVDFWNEHGDARTSQWLLTKDPLALLVIIFVYLVFVLKILPTLCGSKKREHLRYLLGIYCFMHSLISCMFVVVQIYLFITERVDIFCMKLQQDFEGVHYHAALLCYAWIFFKLSEMIETILTIIIVGKATLFEYLHHCLHPLVISLFAHFSPGGTGSMWGLVNNTEHCILYFFLALRNVSPEIRELTNSWFKKFHIILSLCFFSTGLALYILMKNGPDCDPPAIKIVIAIAIGIFFYISISSRWDYISRDDAFGRTRIVRFINLLLQNGPKKIDDDENVIESPCLGYTYTIKQERSGKD